MLLLYISILLALGIPYLNKARSLGGLGCLFGSQTQLVEIFEPRGFTYPLGLRRSCSL